MNLVALAKATQIAAAVSSIALARRRAEHVPAAIALVVLAAIPLLRDPLRDVLRPSDARGEEYVPAALRAGSDGGERARYGALTSVVCRRHGANREGATLVG